MFRKLIGENVLSLKGGEDVNMKKILLFIFMIFGICGCSCNKDELIKIKKDEAPTILESSGYLYTKHRLLTYQLNNTDEYDAKIANKDSFVLFVYKEGCLGCDNLSPAIKKYLDENEGSVIYSIEISEIGLKHTLYKDYNISGTPWILVVKEGNIEVKEIMPAFDVGYDEMLQLAEKWFYDLMENNVSWEE